ncbi:hypothetical protein NDU88_002722 [Pleurodeles waltl]|uniref:Uncharacterized protein n=1 Tax=Pleurodeles waltl TaxID=8319 RepID=A0AAV7M1I3_PLEWA|nr:hypothetical protein NDU88_002722 [Pleurodeles waltl]
MGGRRRPLPFRAAQTRLPQLRRVEVGHSVNGVSPWGAPCLMHTGGSEGEYVQGLGRLTHSDDLHSPPRRGLRPKPLRRSRRTRVIRSLTNHQKLPKIQIHPRNTREQEYSYYTY